MMYTPVHCDMAPQPRELQSVDRVNLGTVLLCIDILLIYTKIDTRVSRRAVYECSIVLERRVILDIYN
jgi:hypothetical protein